MPGQRAIARDIQRAGSKWHTEMDPQLEGLQTPPKWTISGVPNWSIDHESMDLEILRCPKWTYFRSGVEMHGLTWFEWGWTGPNTPSESRLNGAIVLNGAQRVPIRVPKGSKRGHIRGPRMDPYYGQTA